MSRSTRRCHTSRCETETTEGYCDQHRCATNGCQHAHRFASQYCRDHITCTKPNCVNPQYIDDRSDARRPVCMDHWYTCQEQECLQYGVDFSYYSYCREHKCRAPRCRLRRLTGYAAALCDVHICREYQFQCTRIGANFLKGRKYCKTHTCEESECSTIASYAEPNDTSESRVCAAHRCSAAACPRPREANRSHCVEHAICGKQNCSAEKRKGERFCSTHENTCIRMECPQPREAFGWYYWARHIVRTYSYWHLEGYSEACIDHKCHDISCGTILALDATSLYCAEHTVCGKQDCTSSRRITDRFCKQHTNTCLDISCNNLRIQYGNRVEFCQEHVCSIWDTHGCYDKKQPGREFCQDHHICEEIDCEQVYKLPNKACRSHLCEARECIKSKCSEYSDYCTHRTYIQHLSLQVNRNLTKKLDVCSAEGCFDPRASMFNSGIMHAYCSNHRPLPQLVLPHCRADSGYELLDANAEVSSESGGDDSGSEEDDEAIIVCGMESCVLVPSDLTYVY